MSDENRIKTAQFHALIVPLLRDAYNLARYLTRDPAAAEDVVQEACLRAYRHVDALRGPDARPWLLTIVRNCVYAAHAAERSTSEKAVRFPADEKAAVNGHESPEELLDEVDPQAILERSHDQALVQELIARLPTPFREAIVLRELNELSYRQISEVTGVPIGTVMSRLARARSLLRKAWLAHPGNRGDGP